MDGAGGTAGASGEADATAVVAAVEDDDESGGLDVRAVAAITARSAFAGACHLAYLFGNGDLRDEDFLDRIEREILGDLVFKIRERATPEVLAQQRVISKLRSTADLTRPERIGLKMFAAVILEIDAFATDERARLQMASREKAEPVSTPIEDTVMEPIGDVMDGF